MLTSKKSKLVSAGVVAVIIAGALAGVGFGLMTQTTSAKQVDVRVNGESQGSQPVNEAKALASQRVGFDVTIPESLPIKDLELQYIDTDLGPPGLPNALRRAIVVFTTASPAGPVLRIEETGVAIGEPADRARALAVSGIKAKVFRQDTDRATGIWGIGEARSFLVTLEHAPGIADDAFSAMVQELAAAR